MSIYEEIKRRSFDVSEPFYFGYMSRQQAEEYLYKNAKKPGSYLLRDNDNGFRISVVIKTKFGLGVGIEHYLVFKDDLGSYFLFENIVFSSIYGLIEHYSKKESGLRCPLKIPCKKKISPSLKPPALMSSCKGVLGKKVSKGRIQTVKRAFSARLSDRQKHHTIVPQKTVPALKQVDRKKCLQILSNGQYATLWKGEFADKKETVAFKMAAMSYGEKYNRVLREQASVMQLLRHQHIAEVLEFVHDKQPYIVMKYYVNKDISNVLLQSGNYEIEYSQRQRMATEIATALEFVAHSGFVHRNVKASNVLVDRDLSCKLSGFSYVKKLNRGTYYQQEGDIAISNNYIPWMAPETFSGGVYSTASDVWAYASFVFEIFTNGEAPFAGCLVREIGERVMAGERPVKPDSMPDSLYELLLACWNTETDLRPSFSELAEGYIRPRNTMENTLTDIYVPMDFQKKN